MTHAPTPAAQGGDALRRAIEILRAEAAALCKCHTIDGKDWTGEDEAKAAHDEMLAVAAALASPAPAQAAPHAVLRYERGAPGRENEMPRVVSCDWLPDGDYPVYLAASPQPSAKGAPLQGSHLQKWSQVILEDITPPTEPAPQPEQACTNCGGTGEYLAHALTCNDGLCAINGDEHSCAGLVERCGCATPQPEQAQAAQVVPLLSESEQRAILRDPVAIARLINYHDAEEAGADAIEPGLGTYHTKRVLELLAVGRAVIAEDPGVWTERECKEFAPRYSERAATTEDPK